MTRARVALLLLDEHVYLQRVVAPLLADPRIELRAAVLLPPSAARSAHPKGARGLAAIAARTRLYGPRAIAALGAAQLSERIRSGMAGRTLGALARRHGVEPIRWVDSVNAPALAEEIRRSGAEVVLGVVSERVEAPLLAAAPRGIVLLHYSLLPRFAGREPTFWTLLEDPPAGGVTFFRPGANLDGGDVVAQAPCNLTGVRSLHEGILRLSDAAGSVAAEALCRAIAGAAEPQRSAPRRYGWPRPEDVRAFRRKGLRFV